MTQNDFVTVDHILSEVTTLVGDQDMRKGVPKGRYISWIQKAVQELAMDTYFFKKVIDAELPENCQYELPTDIFNIREIYMYNGSLCNPQNTQNVYWKRLFNNMSNGGGYTAKVKDDNSNFADIFVPNQSYNRRFNDYGFTGKKYYFNTYNGVLMLSNDCKGFTYFRVIANSFGGVKGDMPIIPRFFEAAIIDFTKAKYFEMMKNRDPRMYRVLWMDAKNDLENLSTGSWKTARNRVKIMDTAEKESIEEYTSSMFHR